MLLRGVQATLSGAPRRLSLNLTKKLICMHGTDAWLAECQSLRIIRTHALHGANSWSVEKTCTVTCLEYASTIGYTLEPVL